MTTKPPTKAQHPPPPLRIHVATARRAPLGSELIRILEADPRVELRGVSYDRVDRDDLRRSGTHLLISAAHERYLGRSTREAPSFGTVGLHPSLLPAYRGSHPLWWALKNRESSAGLTLYVLDAGIDTGPIISQLAITVRPNDTFGSLYDRVAALTGPLVRDMIASVIHDGRLPEAKPQNNAEATTFGRPGVISRLTMKTVWALRSRLRKPSEAGDDTRSFDRESAIADVIRTYTAYHDTGYDRRWESVGPGDRHTIAERNAWLLRAFEGTTGTVLDLGCGDGNLARLLDGADRRPARYIGVDLIEQRLEWARERVPWGEFILESADRLPLPDRSVDAVAALVLFSSVRDRGLRRGILSEVARVVRPGGRLVVYDLRYPSLRNPQVVPLDLDELAVALPGWSLHSRTLSLVPPLARTRLAATPRRYGALVAVPPLRSHIGAILTAPL